MTQDSSLVFDLKPRDVVHFDYLHLNTAKKISEKQSRRDKHYVYEVEGKARPVLVRCSPREGRGGKWYHVFPLTTKMRKKDRTRRIGRCINPDRVSYIFVEPEWYPENLVSIKNGRSPIMKTLNREEFDNIMKIVGHPANCQGKT